VLHRAYADRARRIPSLAIAQTINSGGGSGPGTAIAQLHVPDSHVHEVNIPGSDHEQLCPIVSQRLPFVGISIGHAPLSLDATSEPASVPVSARALSAGTALSTGTALSPGTALSTAASALASRGSVVTSGRVTGPSFVTSRDAPVSAAPSLGPGPVLQPTSAAPLTKARARAMRRK
jgi:hypothetical protein